jgi:polyhydroxyalkanoate synthesis regulator phasin
MMDQKQIAKQMIQFNKTAFDNSFNAMTMVYEQNEKMVDTYLQQATWMPEEGRKAIENWMQSYKKGCEDFKKLADENYQKVEAFFAGSEE